MKIIEDHNMTVSKQTKYPKTKKKRILKKFKKKHTIQVPNLINAIVLNKDTIICHPLFVRKLGEEVSDNEHF